MRRRSRESSLAFNHEGGLRPPYTKHTKTLNLRVLGSIPRRLTTHSKGVIPVRRDRIHRVSCAWVAERCAVESIHGTPVATRHQVPVNIRRDLNRRVAQLLFHVREGFPLLNQ